MANTKKMTKKVQPEPEKKPQKVFGRIGYGLSLASLICFWFPLLGLGLAIPGYIFANNAVKKGNSNMEFNKKAKRMGIAGLVLGVIVLLVLLIVIPVLAATHVI